MAADMAAEAGLLGACHILSAVVNEQRRLPRCAKQGDHGREAQGFRERVSAARKAPTHAASVKIPPSRPAKPLR